LEKLAKVDDASDFGDFHLPLSETDSPGNTFFLLITLGAIRT